MSAGSPSLDTAPPARFDFPLAVRAVALDLDGTLLDTIGELASGVAGLKTSPARHP